MLGVMRRKRVESNNLLFCINGIYSKEYEKELRDAIRLMFEEFPILRNLNIHILLKDFSENDDEFARTSMCYGGHRYFPIIYLNKEAFCNPEIEKRNMGSLISNCCTITDVIIHELAHILHDCYIAKKFKVNICEKMNARTYRKICLGKKHRKILKNIKKQIISQAKPKYTIADFRIAIQLYAISDGNSAEFFAECFMNYYSQLKYMQEGDNSFSQRTYDMTLPLITLVKKVINEN